MTGIRPDGMDRATWDRLIVQLEATIPYYEEMNRRMTFGLADRWRKRLVETLPTQGKVLELGSGPGTLARHLGHLDLVCIEPSAAMAQTSRQSLPDLQVGRGVAEALPYRDGSFSAAVMAYAFRDFPDKRQALRELMRVVAPGGWIAILDTAPPANPVWRLVMENWFRLGIPLLALVTIPRAVRRTWRVNPYAGLAATWAASGPPRYYGRMVKRAGFTTVKVESLTLGGAYLLTARRP